MWHTLGVYLFNSWFIVFGFLGVISIMTWVEYRKGSSNGDMDTVSKMIKTSLWSGLLLSIGGLGIYIGTKLTCLWLHVLSYLPIFIGICLMAWRQILQYILIHRLNRKKDG